MKRMILLAAILFALSGCTLLDTPIGTLVLSVPDSAYPPAEVTVVASGVEGGQFTFTIEGKTYTQTNGTLTVTINSAPCEVAVTWIGESGSKTLTRTIWLKNIGPVIGRPVLNAITNQWTIHPRTRYVVTFPFAYDPEGGPLKLIDAKVEYVGYEDNTVFCPPYTGEKPPKPDEYHVQTGTGMIANAFVFYSMWYGPLDVDTLGHNGTDLPYTPPSQLEDGYPGGGTCGLTWDTQSRSSSSTVITATFEDEVKATTTESWTIPTNPYPGCGIQTCSSVAWNGAVQTYSSLIGG